MADDFLGKKMEDYLAGKSPHPSKRKSNINLTSLLLKNRSHRAFDNSFVVREDQLKSIINVNTKVPSARNRQTLRFRPVLQDESHNILPHIKLGAALPDLQLPPNGFEPRAFIVICTTKEPDKFTYIDLGISAQSMLLRATEMGLNGICIAAFDKEAIINKLALPFCPLLIIAIGKGADKIEIVPTNDSGDLDYYRKDEIHYVPKLDIEELIIPPLKKS
jgi:nitroreductase